MIELDGQTLKKLQQTELEILTEFDRVCRKNGIKYSLTGGTLLGAIRNGGFIPWDDDADVSMLRDEYEKFKSVLERDLDHERFYFQDMEDTPGYRWGYGKLRKRNTVFLREHQEDMPYEQGIFMDIFPRDGVPDGKIMRKIHKLACFCVRKVLWSAVGRHACRSKAMRIWYSILYRIFGNGIYGVYRRLVRASNRNGSTELVRALTFPVPRGYPGYRREWYGSYVDVQFEGRPFMAEKGHIEWLSQEFGNYMELPPIEKRKVHPVVEIQL